MTKIMSDYIATEPEPVTVYPDQTGKLHLSRDDAIQANFAADLDSLVEKVLYEEGGIYKDGEFIVPVLKNIAKNKPDFLRILVGDRSMT